VDTVLARPVICCSALVALMLAACGGMTGPTQVATQLAFTVQPPSSLVSESYFSVIVTIEDQAGNVVTTATNAVTLAAANSSGSVFLHGNTATTIPAVQGVAKFDSMEIGRAGSGFALTATATGLTGATSTLFTITPGQPYQYAFLVQPSTTPLGSPLPTFSAAIEDGDRNIVTTDTTHIALIFAQNPTGAKLAGNTYVAPVNGVATFTNLSINLPSAGYSFYAQGAAAQNAAQSASFDITIPFVSVSTGDQHTCGVSNGGAVYCWGYNFYGQLGNGQTGFAATPAPVKDSLIFAAVSAGEHHTCAVTTGGVAHCWGYDADGALGNGATTFADSLPVAVSGGLTFSSLSATGGNTGLGSYPGFTCGITTGHAAYCWGDNGGGELGDSSTTNSATPVAVLGGLAFASVSAGGSPHACGVTTTGAAYCWGADSVGNLGTGATTNSLVPVPVANGLTFASVSARNGHSCGVATAGAAYCWGWNQYGQLGVGTTTGPQQCAALGSTTPCSTSPVAVSGGLTFTSGSAGGGHTCALTTAGAAYCWGDNSSGQLGNGTTTNSSTPVPVAGGLTFTAISSGSIHTCGITAKGSIYCWGSNAWGELGNGAYGAGVYSTGPALVAP
jgi:alpha-tubulin suppressor-like RCC1 family protein